VEEHINRLFPGKKHYNQCPKSPFFCKNVYLRRPRRAAKIKVRIFTLPSTRSVSFHVATNRAETQRSAFSLLEGVVCIPPHNNPDNGRVDCSNRNNEGSQCDFTCNANYALNGSSQSVCLDDGNGDGFGAWSNPAPKCDRE